MSFQGLFWVNMPPTHAHCWVFYVVWSFLSYLVEYNTCRNVPIAESQAGGIDDKAEAVRNIHRYNFIENVNVGIRINNQHQSSDVEIYGNIFLAKRAGIRLLTNINGVVVYNNTLYSGAKGYGHAEGIIENVSYYNNIVNAVTDYNIEWYADPASLKSNYNVYTPSMKYRTRTPNQAYFSLQSFQATAGYDMNSVEKSCEFVDATTNDFHLQATSGCKTLGKVGGVSTGADMELGAYGVTTCVGHTCNITEKIPENPTNLTAQ